MISQKFLPERSIAFPAGSYKLTRRFLEKYPIANPANNDKICVLNIRQKPSTRNHTGVPVVQMARTTPNAILAVMRKSEGFPHRYLVNFSMLIKIPLLQAESLYTSVEKVFCKI